jgi:hypothetical protein
MKFNLLILLFIIGACAKPATRSVGIDKKSNKTVSRHEVVSELTQCKIDKSFKDSIQEDDIVISFKPRIVDELKKLKADQLWLIENDQIKLELNLMALMPILKKETSIATEEMLRAFAVANNLLQNKLANFRIELSNKKSVVFITNNELEVYKVSDCDHKLAGVVIPVELKDELDVMSFTQCQNSIMDWNITELTSGEFSIVESNGTFVKLFNFDESKDLYRNGWLRKHYNFQDEEKKYDLEIIKKSLIGKLTIKGLQRSSDINVKEELKCSLFESK